MLCGRARLHAEVPPPPQCADVAPRVSFTCVSRLADTLKPEYKDALRAVELEGQHVTASAKHQRLSASNAAVRLFRARQALKKRVVQSCGVCAEHGCIDCTCRTHAH